MTGRRALAGTVVGLAAFSIIQVAACGSAVAPSIDAPRTGDDATAPGSQDAGLLVGDGTVTAPSSDASVSSTPGSDSAGSDAWSSPDDGGRTSMAPTCPSGNAACVGNAVACPGSDAAPTPCPAFAPVCNGGTCGVCGAGTSQCVDGGARTCSLGGTWNAPVDCTGRVCLSGSCAGVCSPGDTQCDDAGRGVETCDGLGEWGIPVTCTMGICVMGKCVGVCAPPALQCSGNGVQTCGADGGWGAPVDCVNKTCDAGECTGVCAPGQTQCNGQSVQTCASGVWQPGEACVAATCLDGGCQGNCAPDGTGCTNQTCVDAVCTGVCAPGQSGCNGVVPWTCGPTGSQVPGAVTGGVCGAACTPGATETCNPSPACNTSTVTCTGEGVFPSCPAPVDPQWNGVSVGSFCEVGVGACVGLGDVVCTSASTATCGAVASTPSSGWHTTAAAGGSWDWNCDGVVEPEYVSNCTWFEGMCLGCQFVNGVCTGAELSCVSGGGAGVCCGGTVNVTECKDSDGNCIGYGLGTDYPQGCD